jgi:hypothetical protein
VTVIAAEEIPSILTELGWQPKRQGDRTWRCGVSTSVGELTVVVRHAGTWLYFAVMPFLEPEAVRPWGAGLYPPRFLGRILAVNNNLVLVKFALDEDGDLALRVELPTESLQRREVETAAQLIVRTTEQYRGPIRDALLTLNPSTAPPPGTTSSSMPPPSGEDPDVAAVTGDPEASLAQPGVPSFKDGPDPEGGTDAGPEAEKS